MTDKQHPGAGYYPQVGPDGWYRPLPGTGLPPVKRQKAKPWPWIVTSLGALIIVLVGVIVALASSGGGDEDTAAPAANTSQTEPSAVARSAPEVPAVEKPTAPAGPKTTFENGTWRIGQDIAPGTYRTAGDGSCYWARLSGTSGDFEDIIANGNTDGPEVVTIEPSDVAFKSSGCGSPWTLTEHSSPGTSSAPTSDGGSVARCVDSMNMVLTEVLTGAKTRADGIASMSTSAGADRFAQTYDTYTNANSATSEFTQYCKNKYGVN